MTTKTEAREVQVMMTELDLVYLGIYYRDQIKGAIQIDSLTTNMRGRRGILNKGFRSRYAHLREQAAIHGIELPDPPADGRKD